MNLADYERQAMASAFYPNQGSNPGYTALGLAEETIEVFEKLQSAILSPLWQVINLMIKTGNVAGAIKKVLRDKGGVIDDVSRRAIGNELGDVLWYIAALARELGLSLEDVARLNLEKLEGRVQRGTLGGAGDER